MPTITVDLRRAISQDVNPAFQPLVWDQHRKQILVGGASSSKSYSTAQKIIYKSVAEPGHKILVVRRVAATLRHSVFDQLMRIVTRWNLGPIFRANATDLTIRCLANENVILFAGLDDVEKLKSIEGITDIWIEEASEVSEADFNQLDLRVRGETKYKKQLTLTLNPISTQHWIKKRFFDHVEQDTICHRSTYLDNLRLDADTKANLAAITDPYFKKVYVEGDWGTYGNVVFSNYVIEDFPYQEADLENVCQGMDFGFAHASAIVRAGFRDGELYVFDELYGKGWTNSDFIAYCLERWPDSRGWPLTADSAEPDRIEEWRREGFVYIDPAKKGAGSLRYGIDYLVNRRIHIHATRCQNLAREIAAFKRREGRDGEAIDAFLEVNDDTIAALRYATEYIWSGQGGVYQPAGYALDDLGL